jgi:hypothetical protein
MPPPPTHPHPPTPTHHPRLQVKHTVTGTLALLRANHPEDCMSCDVNGKCEFQDLIQRYNVSFTVNLRGALHFLRAGCLCLGGGGKRHEL